MNKKIKVNIKKLKKRYVELLTEFVSIKTVSTNPSFKKEIQKSVIWLSSLFKKNNFKVNILKGKEHNPIVIAKYIFNQNLKTILVYGHYDVQPADKKDGWKNDPFKLRKVKNKYIARGVIDNKGQILAHMTAVFSAIKEKTLSSNVIFMIEGNEESGNPFLSKIIEKNKKLLECDMIVISDGEMKGKNPALDISFRGGGNMRIVYKAGNNDLHSGLFGGLVPNPVYEISHLLLKLKDDLKRKVSKDRILFGGLTQTIEVSGIVSGYTGHGFKNIIPAKSEARLNIRTVYPQISNNIVTDIEKFIKKNTPKYIKLSIEKEVHGDPIYLDTKHSCIKSIKNILAGVYKNKVLEQHVGGSIPVVQDFKSILNKPIAMIPLSNEDCNMHGVDENLSEYHMIKALEFCSSFWREEVVI